MSFLKLLFVRHAESVGNQQHRMQGHGASPLSRQGVIQAQKLVQRLRAEVWHPTSIYSSELKRAVETAAILQELAPHASVQCDQDLNELHPGILQGLTWAEAQHHYPDLCQALEQSLDWIPIPEAETPQAAHDRASHFIQTLLNRHTEPDRILIVTHGGFLPYLVAALLNSDRVWGIQVGYTALFEFWLARSHFQAQPNLNRFNTALWQIRRFNDVQHLSDHWENAPIQL
jgi:broad specificity phosphatase PhoE